MSRKEAAIQLKLAKAKSLLSEVETLMKMKFYTTAISRLDYSCYHASRALLLTKDIVPKTHKGVSKMLHEHFVHKGLFDPAKATFYNKILEERIEDDYNDFIILDEAEVIGFIEPAKQYVEYVSNLIEEYFDTEKN